MEDGKWRGRKECRKKWVRNDAQEELRREKKGKEESNEVMEIEMERKEGRKKGVRNDTKEEWRIEKGGRKALKGYKWKWRERKK